MTDTPALVIPRRARGLVGDPAEHGLPETYHLVSLTKALETIYDFDAHAVMYHVPGQPHLPRLNKSAYQYLKAAGQSVVAEFIMVDVDNPNHASWESEEQIAKTYEAVKNTVLGAAAGFYATRKGYRLFWRLPAPLDVIYLESLMSQTIAQLALEGIHADPACSDWTRLFRLPFAVPDGSTTHLALPYDFDHGVLPWWPEKLTEGKAPKRSASIGQGWSVKHPPIVPPTDEDIELLKGHGELYKRVRKGKPLADPGNRTNTMVKAVGIVASRLADPQPEAIFRVLAYSVAIDRSDTAENGRPPAVDELWSVCKKIAANALTEKQERTQFIEELREIGDRNRKAYLDPNTDPPTPDSTAPKPYTTEGLREVVLFTASEVYYVLNETASHAEKEHIYEGPFKATALPAMLEKYAPRAAPEIRNSKGGLISTAEILTRYGAEVKQVHAYINKIGIRYDPVNRFIREGVAALRADLTPCYNPQIDKWLRLCGAAQVEKFLDWLATFIYLDKPTCGLYLKSDGGVGKGMLAEGLARLWGVAPTMYANIIGTHNDGLALCPLIWADEEIPASHYGKTPSAVFRVLVGNSVFNLRRMYQPIATLHGCVRLLVTANNDNALRIHEDLSPEDYQAIVDRMGYIAIPIEAKEYLESIGGRAATEAWVSGDGIARHVLWLAQNRVVQHDARWLVKGWPSPFHKRLQSTSGIASLVVEVVAHAIASKSGPNIAPGFVLGNGVVYASVTGVADFWQNAMGETNKTPPKARILSALRQLSTQAEPTSLEVINAVGDYDRVTMWPLRPHEILQAVEQYQLGDTAPLERSIDTKLR